MLLFTGWVQPSLLGYLFVAGQAAFVAVVVRAGIYRAAQVGSGRPLPVNHAE